VSIVGDFTDHASSRLKLVDWDSFGSGATPPAAAAAADAPGAGTNGAAGASSSSGAAAAAAAPSAVDYFADIDRNVTALHR